MAAKSSALRKFERGVEHMQAVCSEARTFQNSNAYELRVKDEPRSAEEILYRCFAVPRKPLPDHWPLWIGDAVQNMRNSLDHLVYTAAGGRGRTQFPIFDDPCDFQVLGIRDLQTVPKAIRTLIEEVQPFKTIPRYPHTDSLAVLSDLSNHDKHRDIATLVGYVDIPWLSHDEGLIEIVSHATGQPLSPDKETEVMAFIVRGPEAAKMKVYPDFAFEVRIERVRRNRKTKQSVPLIATLENVAGRVANVIDVIEGRVPLSVWLAPAVAP